MTSQTSLTFPTTTILGLTSEEFIKCQREEVNWREMIEYLEGGSIPPRNTGDPCFTMAHITIFRFYDGPVLLPIGPVLRYISLLRGSCFTTHWPGFKIRFYNIQTSRRPASHLVMRVARLPRSASSSSIV